VGPSTETSAEAHSAPTGCPPGVPGGTAAAQMPTNSAADDSDEVQGTVSSFIVWGVGGEPSVLPPPAEPTSSDRAYRLDLAGGLHLGPQRAGESDVSDTSDGSILRFTFVTPAATDLPRTRLPARLSALRSLISPVGRALYHVAAPAKTASRRGERLIY
jgi:hypothetical protein